jgi:hypothetical protein
MSRIRVTALQVVLAGIVIFCVGCRKRAQDADSSLTASNASSANANPAANNAGANVNPKVSKPAGAKAKAFLDKKKRVPPGLEWNTNVIAKKAGQFSFRVASQGPFSVTVVNDAGYQALQRNDQNNFKKSDVLLTVDSRENTYEGKVAVSAGTTWFIIENHAQKEVELHLQCFAP